MSDVGISSAAVGRVGRQARRHVSSSLAVCFLVIGGVVVTAVLGSAVAPHDPAADDMLIALTGPSGEHWLGTDRLGRDVLSRLIAGARTAFVGPLLIAIGSMVFGNLLGLWAGYRRGRVDAVVMRWVDLMWSMPGLLVIVVVGGAVGGGYWLAVVLLMVLTVPFDTRVIRGAVLEQVPRPYVEAAKTVGVRDRRIMLSHIWPNVSPVAVANTCLVFAGAIVGLSGLSFLGLGAEPGTPDWGLMLADGQTLLFANPVAALAPGVMIVATAASMNVIGDWLYERLSRRSATR